MKKPLTNVCSCAIIELRTKVLVLSAAEKKGLIAIAQITVNGKELNTCAVSRLVRYGEANADVFEIQLPRFYGEVDLTTLGFVLHGYSEQNTLVTQTLELLSQDENALTLRWVVGAEFTAVPGKLLLELKGLSADGETILKFTGGAVDIAGTAFDETLLPPTLAEQLLDQLEALIAAARTEFSTMAQQEIQSAITALDWDEIIPEDTVRSNDITRIVRLTQSEYDALAQKEDRVLYCIC